MKQFILLFVIIMSFGHSSQALVKSAEVTTKNSARCKVYLRVPEGAAKLPIVVNLGGSGIYSFANDSELSPAVNYIYRASKAMVLTFDKPGISVENEKIKVDDEIYNQLTIPEIANCLDESLKWAMGLPDISFDGRLFINAHSEGALVAVIVMHRYARFKDPTLGKIKMLLLSGLPMEPFKKVIAAQVSKSEKKKFWKAYERKDNKYLRTWGAVSHKYLSNAFEAKSLDTELREFSLYPNQTDFQIFQGLNDKLTPPDAIRTLEKWNNEQVVGKRPSLKLSARYYEADHNLNLTAMNDMALILMDAF